MIHSSNTHTEEEGVHTRKYLKLFEMLFLFTEHAFWLRKVILRCQRLFPGVLLIHDCDLWSV